MMVKIFIATGFMLISTIVSAGVPNYINFQGRLADDAGEPVSDGDYNIFFSIYDAAEDGAILWTSDRMTVPVEGGLFSVELGPLTPGIFASTGDRYLGIKVGADPEITPRTHLTSTAYSHQALRSDTSGHALDIADNCVTGEKVSDGSLSGLDLDDEPGIASNLELYQMYFDTTYGPMDSVSITVPTPGYIVVSATGRMILNTHGGTGTVYISISKNADQEDHDCFYTWDVPESFPLDYYYQPLALTYVDRVLTIGTYKYYLVGKASTGYESSVDKTVLLAVFYPTAYGTVEESK